MAMATHTQMPGPLQIIYRKIIDGSRFAKEGKKKKTKGRFIPYPEYNSIKVYKYKKLKSIKW